MPARPAPLQPYLLVPDELSALRSGLVAQGLFQRSTPLSPARIQCRTLKDNLVPRRPPLSCGSLQTCHTGGTPLEGQTKPGTSLPKAPWNTPNFHHGDSRLDPCTARLCTLRVVVDSATRFGSKINAESFMEVQWTRDPGTKMAKCWPSLQGSAADHDARDHGYWSDIDGVPVAGQSVTNRKISSTALAMALPLCSFETPSRRTASRC